MSVVFKKSLSSYASQYAYTYTDIYIIHIIHIHIHIHMYVYVGQENWESLFADWKLNIQTLSFEIPLGTRCLISGTFDSFGFHTNKQQNLSSPCDLSYFIRCLGVAPYRRTGSVGILWDILGSSEAEMGLLLCLIYSLLLSCLFWGSSIMDQCDVELT